MQLKAGKFEFHLDTEILWVVVISIILVLFCKGVVGVVEKGIEYKLTCIETHSVVECEALGL